MSFAIKLSLFFAAFVLSSCVTPGDGEKTIKKEIRDDNNRAKKEDIGPLKRLMILPFLDSAAQRKQELRDHARAEFIKELNRTGAVVTIDSKDLKSDFSKLIKNEEYDMPELSRLAHTLGVCSNP